MFVDDKTRIANLEREREDLERRLIDVSWSAMSRVLELYKLTPRADFDEVKRLKLLEEVVQGLEILHLGGPLG